MKEMRKLRLAGCGEASMPKRQKGGEKAMEKVMKKLGLILVAMFFVCGGVFAADWGDSFTITLTPSGDRGVIISTDTAIALGDLATGTTITHPFSIPVTSTGSISGIEYTINGGTLSVTSTLSADGHADSDDELALFVLFQDTAPASTGWEAVNTTTNLVTFSAKQVGDTSSSWTSFEGDNTAPGTNMDSLALNVKRYLWFRVKSPLSWTSGGTQTITVTVTAEAAN